LDKARVSGVNILIDVAFPLPHTCTNLPCFVISDVVTGRASSPELRLERICRARSIAPH
jgi:hypothetical protein